MMAFLLTGVIGGLVGALFVRVNLWATKTRRRNLRRGRLWMLPSGLQTVVLRWLGMRQVSDEGEVLGAPPLIVNVSEAILIAFVTALLNVGFTVVLRSMSVEAIHALFETCPHRRARHFGLCDDHAPHRANLSASASLILASGIRLLQTSYTFGAALPSGLFIPALFVGAAMGRFIGNVMVLFTENAGMGTYQTHVEPGVFAMVGAAAILAGFCRMTVSLVVIMLELTGEITYVVPFMCATFAAKIVGDMFTPSICSKYSRNFLLRRAIRLNQPQQRMPCG